MLRGFRVIAILESLVEPWFTEARINTAATILQRTDDAQARAGNNIKFVLLRKKLSDLLPGQDRSEEERQHAADALIAEIESMTESTADERWRVRVVNQGKLTVAGWQYEDENVKPPVNWNGDWTLLCHKEGRYLGTKWNVYLRAPDLFFDLLDAFKGLMPLHEVALLHRGITSGADEFFYVEDVTDRIDNKELAEVYGLTRDQTGATRIIKAGDGSAHLIEARYLKPLVFNVMEVSDAVVDGAGLRKKVVLVSEPPEALEGTHVLRYLRYGESNGIHERPTCASRVSEDPQDPRQWYDLRPPEPGAILWPQAHQYRHIVPLNPEGHICNKRFFNVYPRHDVHPKVLAALLNSTLTWFFKVFHGRSVGREGFLDTDVFATRLIPVVNAKGLPKPIQQRLVDAFDALSRRPLRPIHPMGDELEQVDRNELDDAVFEALGVTDPTERKHWRERLYNELRKFYQHGRELEEVAQANRVKAARKKQTASARSIAKEIWREIDKEIFRRFPQDFVPVGARNEEFRLPEGKIQVGQHLFTEGEMLAAGYIQVGDDLRFVGSMERGEFIQTWQEAGNTGVVPVPRDDTVCSQALRSYRQYREGTEQMLMEVVAGRTSDENLQRQVLTLLWRHINELVHVRKQQAQ